MIIYSNMIVVTILIHSIYIYISLKIKINLHIVSVFNLFSYTFDQGIDL